MHVYANLRKSGNNKTTSSEITAEVITTFSFDTFFSSFLQVVIIQSFQMRMNSLYIYIVKYIALDRMSVRHIFRTFAAPGEINIPDENIHEAKMLSFSARIATILDPI
jgi:hypothetical protein